MALLAIGGGLFLIGKRTQTKKREELAAKLKGELAGAEQTLELLLAELASYRRTWTLADAAAHDLEELLRSISLGDTLYQGPPDEPAALLSEPAGGGTDRPGGEALAKKLADWDLVPPPSPVQGVIP